MNWRVGKKKKNIMSRAFCFCLLENLVEQDGCAPKQMVCLNILEKMLKEGARSPCQSRAFFCIASQDSYT